MLARNYVTIHDSTARYLNPVHQCEPFPALRW